MAKKEKIGILEASDAHSEIAKAMNCGTGGGHLSDAAFSAVIEFTDKHNVSLDWLLFGDLKGLLRTVRAKQQST